MARIFFIVNLFFILNSAAGGTSSSSSSISGSSSYSESASSFSSSYSSASSEGSKKKKQVKCKSYEEFSNCTQSLCRRLKCSEQGKPVTCTEVDDSSCKSGCVCPAGQLRTHKKACVPENQCYGKLVCKDSEVVNLCPKKHTNDFCPISENEESCSEDEDEGEECGKPVCVCGFNQKKDPASGKCISTRDCPPFSCSRPNEEYNACPPYCPTDNCSQATPTGRCPFPGRIGIVVECKPACRCIEGYWRDNGTCVPYLACPGKCPYNERFSSCIQGECRALNCTQKDQPIACPRIAEGSCKQGCVCVEGTLRASNGSCVAENKCPVTCKSYEEFSNCTQALCRHLKCSEQGKPVDCGDVDEGSCESGCVCPAGQLMTDEGACVPENQCYGKLVCKNNEVVNSCPKKRTNDFCPISENEEGCSEVENEGEECGKPVCVCGFNQKKDPASGKCISTRDCPPFSCSRPNEEYNACPPYCPTDNCSQATPTGRCPFPGRIGIVVECKPACQCIEGYWRDNGTCVPYLACPGKCPYNERFSSCIQGECRALNCTQKDQPIACSRIAEGFCKQGCVCVEGTLRASNGSCVAEDKCPDPICGKNEYLNECANGCDPFGCPKSYAEEQARLADCVAPAVCLPTSCTCLPEYRRDRNQNCIYIGKCPGICPENEEFTNCTQTLNRPQNCPGSGSIDSPEDQNTAGCVCKEHMLRDLNGNCVPKNQCPALECGQNEISSCVYDCPPEKTCKTRNIQFRCMEPTKECEQKCVCKPDHYRNPIGECVTAKQCDKCNGPNEFFSCGQECDNECSMLDKQNRTNCPYINIVCNPMCYCEDGFARDPKKQCIPVEECPIVCGENEQY